MKTIHTCYKTRIIWFELQRFDAVQIKSPDKNVLFGKIFHSKGAVGAVMSFRKDEIIWREFDDCTSPNAVIFCTAVKFFLIEYVVNPRLRLLVDAHWTKARSMHGCPLHFGGEETSQIGLA